MSTITPMVRVADFSSVLEIAFSISLIFFVFEVSPWMKRRSRTLLGDLSKLHLWNQIRAGKAGRTWTHFAKLMVSSGAAVGLIYSLLFIEVVLLLYTLAGALGSLGLLVWTGYDPSLSVGKDLMTVILVLLFAPLPVYLLEHFFFSLIARNQLNKLTTLVEQNPGGVAPS